MIDLRFFQIVAFFAAFYMAEPDGQVALFGIDDLVLAGIIITMTATGYSTYSQYETQKQAADNAEDQAAYNARVAENEAKEEEQRRSLEAHAESLRKRRARAAMEAQYATSGVLMTGTPAAVLTEQAGTDEWEIQEKNRQSAIWANNTRSQGAMAIWQGNEKAEAYNQAATNSLISGVGNMAGQALSFAYSWQKPASAK